MSYLFHQIIQSDGIVEELTNWVIDKLIYYLQGVLYNEQSKKNSYFAVHY